MTTIPFRRVLTLVLIFVILASSLIVLDRGSYLRSVRTGLDELVSPMSSALYSWINRSGTPSDLEAELAAVRQERDALVAQNSQLTAENESLQQQIREEAAESRYPGVNLMKAHVIRRDPTGNQMALIIDLGSSDGVREGMAVVNPDILVGQVVEVTETTSKVLLIVDASEQIGAMLLDSRADGIIYGQWQVGGHLVMRHVRSNVTPTEGEWVVTSGLSQTQTRQVPPNIPIGIVIGDPIHDEQTDTLEFQVQPGIGDFNSLTVVYVAVNTDDNGN